MPNKLKANQGGNSICFVIPKYVLYTIGGAELQVYFLVKEFLSRGWAVEVVCRFPDRDLSDVNKEFIDDRVKLHFYKKEKIRSKEFFNVLRVLKRTNSGYYYQRTDYALTGATALYCRSNNKKMIYACAQQGDTVRKKYLTELKELQYNNVLKRFVRFIDFYFLDKMIEFGKSKAHAVVCQTVEQKESFSTNFKREVNVVNNSFSFTDNQSIVKENIILWVGNWRQVKQPEVFIQVVDRLIHNSDWKFVMIGKANETTQGLVKPLEEHNNFEVYDALPLYQVNDWYSKSKVLVNTSSQEGMPNTFIQAWHYKLKVLSLNVNPNELLNNNDFGTCCRGDIETLVSKLKREMDKPTTLSEEAKEYVNKNFSAGNNVDRLINILKQQ